MSDLRHSMTRAFAIAAFLLSAGIVESRAAETLTPLQKRGEALARGMCSGCHSVERIGDSPHPAAPQFRSLDNRTDLSKLARRLREGLLDRP